MNTVCFTKSCKSEIICISNIVSIRNYNISETGKKMLEIIFLKNAFNICHVLASTIKVDAESEINIQVYHGFKCSSF